jgi:nucleoside-diphosphate-sugar epimerase
LRTAEVRDPEEVIRPAVDGTRRVLGAALRAGVARVVLTSSVAAVAFGWEGTSPRGDAGYVFSDADWSDAERCDAYAKRCAETTDHAMSCHSLGVADTFPDAAKRWRSARRGSW